ncbi:hypothetical protein HDF16_000214 [Granulicella aggregans]|uniref:Uncharacterized protein n=1 Tax=Granulicella aggregans TaxID=474949 RepID=A0A7W7Z974_9BACT|nr:hypothetical protein [Granulicella aggregans]MBB5055545.1 hypothetical protein [Granulicella aggregans]
MRIAFFTICAAMAPLLPAQHTSFVSAPAKSWAVDAAAKEVDIINHSGSYIRYRQRAIDDRGDELRDVIESKDGAVARLIMRDNRPLTPEEDQAERDRLTGLLDHPSDYARHVKNENSSKKMAIDIIKVMPDAMIYTYAPDQSPSHESSAPQVVIDYVPDPAFNPPNTTSVALTGLRGRIWIDANAKTIVHMTGDIFRPVNFGWGMLAHVYPGGKLDFEQASAAGSRWNMTSFHEDVTARALMVKTIAVKKEFQSLDFQPMPSPMSYQDAIHLLLNTPLPK